MEEDWDMILRVNPKLFSKNTGSIGFEYCPKCKKMMWWDDKKDLWHCDDCSITYEQKVNINEEIRNKMARESLAEISSHFVNNNNLSQEQFWLIQEKVLTKIKNTFNQKMEERLMKYFQILQTIELRMEIPNSLKLELLNSLEDERKKAQRDLLMEFIINQDSLEKIQSLIKSKVEELKIH